MGLNSFPKTERRKLAWLESEMAWLQLASIIELKIVCFRHLLGADSGRPTCVPEPWKDDVRCAPTLMCSRSHIYSLSGEIPPPSIPLSSHPDPHGPPSTICFNLKKTARFPFLFLPRPFSSSLRVSSDLSVRPPLLLALSSVWLRGFECKIEWDCLTKRDERVLHVQSAKGEIESFRAGRAHWGIRSFPRNCGSESLIS